MTTSASSQQRPRAILAPASSTGANTSSWIWRPSSSGRTTAGSSSSEEVTPEKYYGTPKIALERAFAEGRDLIADIEIAGAERIKAAYPDNVVLMFIWAHQDVLAERMRARGTSEKDIQERLDRAEREYAFAEQCEALVVNDIQTQAADELRSLIERLRNPKPVHA
ncbi:MAG: hypothetical protein HND48_20640 [Chloroflexi bacterium]|nr:hypothetical protein [Chloroflexota bacterium]